MRQNLDDLAILGGVPLFEAPRPIGQLAAPNPERFFALLRQAYETTSLTGQDGIVRRLEQRLAGLHGTKHCVAFANAWLGIIMVLRLLAAGRPGNVVMPAFGYRGLPHFARWAGQMPRFCDVDEATHCLSPVTAAAGIDAHTTCILGVAAAHSPGDVDGLCSLAASRNVPIFFDSVNALGATYRKIPLGSFGCAEAFSLHATKLLNGFEGGYVTTNDGALAKALRELRAGSAAEGAIPLPAQLNEVHAAQAHASLDGLDALIGRNQQRYDDYRTACASLAGFRILPRENADRERYNYLTIAAEIRPPWPLTRNQTVAILRAEGAFVQALYSPPLHRSVDCPPGLAVDDLPVAETLASRFLLLPSGEQVSHHDVEQVAELLHFIQHHGSAIADRLNEKTAA